MLSIAVFSPAFGQEIYWDNGYYQITKNIIKAGQRRTEQEFYSLILHDDGFTMIRMVYYGPRLFIIIDEKTSMYIEDIKYKDKDFKCILHYDTFIDNWNWNGNKENYSDREFILYYNKQSEYFINDSDGYEYLLDGLIINDGSLPESYYVAYIGSILRYEENIPNIESLEIVFPDNITTITISTEYQQQAIQEFFRLAFRLGLI
jgi:hypothetical protein